MDDRFAVRHLKPSDENIGLDASLTNVAKGKRPINRGVDKRASRIPLPVGNDAKFYAPGHEAPLNKSVPKVNAEAGVRATFKQCLAGENLRNQGPKVFFKRHDQHKVRDSLIDGFRRNLAREQCQAAELADLLALDRMENEQRHEAHTKALFEKLEQEAKKRGFEGTRKPSMKVADEKQKTFGRTIRDPECMIQPMKTYWSPHNKVMDD